jgi:hypothetical protein
LVHRYKHFEGIYCHQLQERTEYNNTSAIYCNGFDHHVPDNSSVNTVQQATIDEAVFSVDLTNAPIDWLDSVYVICVSCDACPFHGYISKSPGGFNAVTSYKLRESSSSRSMGTSKQ